MKDTDRVELTVGDIKRGAEKCGTAKEILKELFPEVFKVSPPEWEDITGECKISSYRENYLLTPFVPGSTPCYAPFCVKITKNSSWNPLENGSLVVDGYEVKLEENKVWRRKSE